MSFVFKPVELSDAERYYAAIRKSLPLGCEYAFGNLFAWSAGYAPSLAEVENALVVRVGIHEYSYCIPLGTTDIKAATDALRKQEGVLRLHHITKPCVDALEKLYPGEFTFTPLREYADYIYKREELALLAGRRFHKKKNHFSSFEKNYTYTYEPINLDNIGECIELSQKWALSNSEKNPDEILRESEAQNMALGNWEALGLEGALLRIDGKVIAYCAGERLSEDTFCTHFEKALPEYVGAYAAINRLFAQNALSQYTYINREDDTGDEGLRQAKLSYQPCELLEKYNAVG